MKKILSILLALFMSMSAAVVFAAESYPEALTVNLETKEILKSATISGTKCDITGANVVSTTERYSTNFGEIASVIDGVGMVNTTCGESTCNDFNRWVSKTQGDTPTITFSFQNNISFNTIKYTEARRQISAYTVKCYDGGSLVLETSGTFTDMDATTSTTTAAYMRTIALGKTVSADKVEFIVTGNMNTKVLSIQEMEFWNDNITVTTNAPTYAGAGSISLIMDGVNTKNNNDGKSKLDLADRWTIDKNIDPTINIYFNNSNVSFDTIKYIEYRKQISACMVTCYDDGVKVFDKSWDSLETNGDNSIFTNTLSLGEDVTADRIEIKITAADLGVFSIAELGLYSNCDAPVIMDKEGNELPAFNNSPLTNAFNGAYDDTPAVTVTDNRYQFLAYDSNNDNALAVETPVTIQFDLGEKKTFNYAELSELRCIFGSIDVFYSNNKTSWIKAGTMPKMEYDGALVSEYVHSISFEPVTARYIRFVINEIASYSDFEETQRTANINEIALRYFENTDATQLCGVRAFGKNIDSLIYSYTTNQEEKSAKYNTVNANAVISNVSSSAKTYMLVAAQYNASGVLVSISAKNIEIPANTSSIENIILHTELTATEALNSRVSCMVWEKDTLVPCCGTTGINEN